MNESDEDLLAARDDAESVKGENESDDAESMDEDDAVEQEPANKEVEYQIVCSRKYKSAVTGMRVNDAGMQTSHMGGCTIAVQKKSGAGLP